MSIGSLFFEENIQPDLQESEQDFCINCGKPLDEFGDLGCALCDRRHSGFGVM